MATIVKHTIPFAKQFVVNTYLISVLFRFKLVTKDTIALWFLEPSEFDFETIQDESYRKAAETVFHGDFIASRLVRKFDRRIR